MTLHTYSFDADLKSVHKRLSRSFENGVIAQLGERDIRNVEAEGSIPFGSTKVWLDEFTTKSFREDGKYFL